MFRGQGFRVSGLWGFKVERVGIKGFRVESFFGGRGSGLGA